MASELPKGDKMERARSQTKPGRYATGEKGLYVQVAQSAGSIARSWILRYMIEGRARQMGLGSLDVVPTTKARISAQKARHKIHDGTDPLDEARAVKQAKKLEKDRAKTFAQCAESVIEKLEKEGKNPKHVAQWRATLRDDVFPKLGNRVIATITKHDVLAVLTPIWDKKPETARRIRGRMEAVFAYAKQKDLYFGENPAAWNNNLKSILPAGKARKRHQPSLPWKQLPQFLAELRNRESMSAMALEFAILCASRSGEVRGATWDEIDTEKKLWTIPADRMKAKREHTVPLTDAALALLDKALALRLTDVPYVFPSVRGGQMSDMAMSQLTRRMNADNPQYVDPVSKAPIVPHGFRSTFRDWAETHSSKNHRYSETMMEYALAHKSDNEVKNAYQRNTLLEERRSMMDDWAEYCTKPLPEGDNVILINRIVA